MEPGRKIEKWLRAYAKKRRGQAKDAFDLHPATRRLLQDEIARKAPAPDEDDDSLSLWEVFRQQWALLLTFAACIFLIGIILLPVLNTAKEKAQHSFGMTKLQQIGSAVQMSAAQNNGRLPASLDELTNGNLAKEDLTDEESGKPIVYLGAGKNLNSLSTNAVLAYSPEDKDNRAVLFANGRTEVVDRKKFEETTNQDMSRIVAMNYRGSLQSESSPSSSRLMANAPSELPPARAPQPAAPMPEANSVTESPSAMPSPSPPSVAVAASEANSASGLPPVAAPAPGTSSISAGPEELSQAKTASSDLAANSGGAPPAELAPPPVAAGGTFTTFGTRREAESPVAGETAAQPQFGSGALNSFQNSVAPSQAVPVLSNFQVQQNGNALRIVDQDGSVYDGSWQLADRVANNGIVEKSGQLSPSGQNMFKAPQTSTPPAAVLADNLQAAQNYFFRVRGMNRTLKQNVVFTGSLLANFALSGNMQQGFGGAVASGYTSERQAKMALTNQAAQLPWSNMRIAGTAIINRTNHIEVNAAPVTPTK
jgi:hypothetical protein